MSAGDDAGRTCLWFDGRVRLLALDSIRDLRGELLPIHLDQLPWPPRRVFTVSNVPPGTTRGGHGHKSAEQLLVCVQGEVEVHLRYQGEEISLTLTPGTAGILVKECVWAEQRYLREHSVLLVLASEAYDPDSYVELPGSEA